MYRVKNITVNVPIDHLPSTAIEYNSDYISYKCISTSSEGVLRKQSSYNVLGYRIFPDEAFLATSLLLDILQ